MPKITKLRLHLLKLFRENYWLLFFRTLAHYRFRWRAATTMGLLLTQLPIQLLRRAVALGYVICCYLHRVSPAVRLSVCHELIRPLISNHELHDARLSACKQSRYCFRRSRSRDWWGHSRQHDVIIGSTQQELLLLAIGMRFVRICGVNHTDGHAGTQPEKLYAGANCCVANTSKWIIVETSKNGIWRILFISTGIYGARGCPYT